MEEDRDEKMDLKIERQGRTREQRGLGSFDDMACLWVIPPHCHQIHFLHHYHSTIRLASPAVLLCQSAALD